MKKIFLFLIFSVITLFSFAQKDSTFCGKWQIIVDAGNKHTTPTYMLLKADSTFMTSGDSTFVDAKQKASQGKWSVTKTGDVKLVPSDTSREIHYYRHQSGWKFKYYENEKNGVRTPVFMLEMDIYIEKLVNVKAVKGGKKKKKK